MHFDPILIAFVVVAGAAVFLFEWSMLRSIYGKEAERERHLKERLAQLKETVREQVADSIVRANTHSVNGVLSRVPGIHQLQQLVLHSGSKTTVGQVLWKSIIWSAFAGSVGWMFTRLPQIAGAAAIAVSLVPFIALKIRAASRLSKFDSQLAEGLDIVTRGLRAGHPFDSTLKLVADELPDPISEEFALVYAELNYGMPLKPALYGLLERVPAPALKAFVTSVIVQKETGGNLAEILENISQLIRDGQKFQRKVRTLSAEGRMSGLVLAAVPLFLAAGLSVIAPDIMSELITNPRGHTLLQFGAVAYVVGFFWMKRITKIDV